MARDPLSTAMSRRHLLRSAGILAGASVVTSLLAACGSQASAPAGSKPADSKPAESKPAAPAAAAPTSPPKPVVIPTPPPQMAAVPTTAPAAAPAGKMGGIFKAALATSPPTLDVSTTTAAASREATLYFMETLITYGEKYDIVPLLAEKWETSPDGKRVTFALKQGVKFHNGKEMTSEDVVASFKRHLDVTVRKSAWEMVEGFTAKDKHTVEFTLKYPTMAFLLTMAFPGSYPAIFPKEIIEGKEANKLAVEDFVGTGPYKLTEWKRDVMIRLRRHDDYHTKQGEPNGVAGGKMPYFDEIQLIPVPEEGARVAGLEAGDYDFAFEPPATDYDRLKDRKDLRLAIVEDSRWFPLVLNHSKAPMSDLKFRQAIQAALDVQAIGMAMTNGKSEFFRVQPSIWYPVSPYYTEAGKELYNQKNLDKARTLLKESGYNGEEIVYITNRNYEQMYRVAVATQDQLQKGLGMNVKLEVMDWPSQTKRRDEQPDTWHICSTSYVSEGLFSPDSYSAYWQSGNKNTFAKIPELDEWFKKGLAATSMDGRKEAFTNVQRIFHEQVVSVKTVDGHSFTALKANIQGYRPWYNPTRFWGCWRG